MNPRKTVLTVLALMAASLVLASAAQAGVAYTRGDVFAAIGGGLVDEFTPTGVLVQTLNDGTGATYTTGMAFDSAGNLYVTNFGPAGTSKFDNSGNLLFSTFLATGAQVTPESVVSTASGFFVGGPAGGNIDQYNVAGALTHSYSVLGGTGTGGTDWLDLQNTNTMLYTGEGVEVRSYNIATSTQNPDFADGLPGSRAFALRVIPPGGTDAGDVLVADSQFAILLGPNGALLHTYMLPGNGGTDFSLNLDPDGTDFWTGDAATGLIWEVNIATGAIDNQFNSGSGSLYGITVFGERVVSQTPEPSSLLLLGSGALGLAGILRRKLGF